MMKETILSSMIFISTSSAVFAKFGGYTGTSLGINTFGQYKHDAIISTSLFVGSSVGLLVQAPHHQLLFYLGGELNLTVDRYSHHGHIYGSSPTFFGLTGSIIPGYKVTENTLVYIRLNLPKLHHDHKPTKKPSLGVMSKLKDNWDLRVEASAIMATPGRTDVNASAGIIYNF